MRKERRGFVGLASLIAALLLLVAPIGAGAQNSAQEGTLRALFVACENFLSQPSLTSSSSNTLLISRAFAAGANTPASIAIEDGTLSSLEGLRRAVRDAFAGAAPGDTSLFYLSTHGVYNPMTPEVPATLLLSDGINEYAMTPQELRSLFDDIPGTKFLILDACNSGAFIEKGMSIDIFFDGKHSFWGDDFKVLTSCGGNEQSWYWDLRGQSRYYGSSYFAIALVNALHDTTTTTDLNCDGQITLRELYARLLRTQPTSTAQVYPQQDDFVVYTQKSVDSAQELILRDISFENTVLSMNDPEITFSYTVTRPVRVLYQLVYTRQGQWDWQNAQLLYDDMIDGGAGGLVQPGRVTRSISLGGIDAESSGYALIQLITVDENRLRVHDGRILCVQPIVGDPQLRIAASAGFSFHGRVEFPFEVSSDFPVSLTVSIYDTEGSLVRRLATQESMRPIGLSTEASHFYWDGTDKEGTLVPDGFYTIKAHTYVGATRYETSLRNVYVTQEEMPTLLTPIG